MLSLTLPWYHAGVEPSGPTRDDLEQLRVWLLKNGLDSKWLEGIEFAANLPEGSGVVAKKDFKKGEPFLQVVSFLLILSGHTTR